MRILKRRLFYSTAVSIYDICLNDGFQTCFFDLRTQLELLLLRHLNTLYEYEEHCVKMEIFCAHPTNLIHVIDWYFTCIYQLTEVRCTSIRKEACGLYTLWYWTSHYIYDRSLKILFFFCLYGMDARSLIGPTSSIII